jgi:glycosyltransferase involved in cell wall biosynthesis
MSTKVPVVFDYVDKSPTWIESKYCACSERIIAVSDALQKEVKQYGKPSIVIPNGVDLQRYRATDRKAAKDRLGLSGKTVVSLIGLTCSPTLYFVESIAKLQQLLPDLAFLIIGEGPLQSKISEAGRRLGIRDIRAPGFVPNAEVHFHYAATDIGLYPGEDTDYYRHSSPLKIVEYSAAGAQVVSSPVDMFSDWPNVRITPPTSIAFTDSILAALKAPRSAPPLAHLDWKFLSRQFLKELQSACGSQVRGVN